MSLTTRALLSNLAISQWTARKFDKRETQELATKHGTAAEAARVNKSLLPMARELDQIHKLSGEIRTDHYRLTLPWAMDGARILPADAYMDYVSIVRPKIMKWEGYARTFVDKYPDLKEQARIFLNGMYREDDYPDPSEVARKFRIDVSFYPVPDADDFRIKLSDDEEQKLREDLSASIQSAQGLAMRECWERLHKVVSHAATVLVDPKAIFRDSLVENAKELCGLLPKLNIADDPNLERMRQEVEAALCSHSPEVLRNPGHTRTEVAARMADVLSKMGAFYQEAA
jgi:hypothetical protein